MNIEAMSLQNTNIYANVSGTDIPVQEQQQRRSDGELAQADGR